MLGNLGFFPPALWAKASVCNPPWESVSPSVKCRCLYSHTGRLHWINEVSGIAPSTLLDFKIWALPFPFQIVPFIARYTQEGRWARGKNGWPRKGADGIQQDNLEGPGALQSPAWLWTQLENHGGLHGGEGSWHFKHCAKSQCFRLMLFTV